MGWLRRWRATSAPALMAALMSGVPVTSPAMYSPGMDDRRFSSSTGNRGPMSKMLPDLLNQFIANGEPLDRLGALSEVEPPTPSHPVTLLRERERDVLESGTG